MKAASIAIVSVLWIYPALSQDVHYTIVNPRNVTAGTDTFYLFDVLMHSNSGFRMGSGQVYFDYDTLTFGANVIYSTDLEIIVPDSSILAKKIGTPPFVFDFYGNFVLNDNTYNRFSFSWQHSLTSSCLEEDNINYYSDILCSVKVRYKTGYSGYNNSICLHTGTNFIDQTFTACGPDNCNTNNCIQFPGAQITEDYYTCEDCRIVYSTADSGTGTLRNAIACASVGDTIRFSPNLRGDSIQISTDEIALSQDVNILTDVRRNITLDASQTNRLFRIPIGDPSVKLEGLEMLGGVSLNGSVILNSGILQLDNCFFGVNGPLNGRILLVNTGTITAGGLTVVRQD